MTPKPEKSKVERDIDDNLRRVYQQMIEEDVPDRFADLLRQLKEQEQGQDPAT